MNKDAVIITGALGGIGRALCDEFHSHGFVVIALDRADGDVAAHVQLKVDIRDLVHPGEPRDRIIGSIREAMDGWQGRLKGLVNNAAIQILGGVEDLSSDDWQETINTNLLAPFFLSQLFLKDLEESAGSIVNISSIHEKLTKKRFVAYATSKSALSGLTRAMAVDLGPRVRVNGICPAAISTPMLEAGFVENPQLLEVLKQAHPSESIGLPDDVAKLAFWLVNEAPVFLTGALIGLDGGISARLHDPL